MLKRNLIANYLGQGWAALMGLAFIPLYIKFLGIEAFGLIGLFAVLIAWLHLLDMGMSPMLTREMARFTAGGHTAQSIRDLLRSIEVIAWGVAILIGGAMFLASSWIATSWVQPEQLPVEVVAQAFAIMGVVTALRFVQGVYRSSIVGLQRQVLFNVVTATLATVRSLGAVAILAWVAPTIQAFFLWQGFVSVATLIILASVTYAALPRARSAGRFSGRALTVVWSFAGGMAAITFLSLLLTKVDKILLSKLLTLGDYGYYALATAVAGALYMLISPVTQAWYPRAVELQASENTVGLADLYHKGAQLVTVIAGSAAVVLIVFSETLLLLWTQDPDLAARTAPLLSILMLGNLLNGLMWIPYQTQLAYGWTSLTIRINAIMVVLLVPAILWVTPRYGAEGAAWVWVALNGCYVLVGVHFMYRRILTKEKWAWYWHDVVAPLGAASISVGALRWMFSGGEDLLSQLAVLSAASIIAILAASLAADRVRVGAWTFLRGHRPLSNCGARRS